MNTAEKIRQEPNGLRTVVVIRHVLFFCQTQEISLARLRQYYTDYAIGKFFDDGFLKWKDESNRNTST